MVEAATRKVPDYLECPERLVSPKTIDAVWRVLPKARQYLSLPYLHPRYFGDKAELQRAGVRQSFGWEPYVDIGDFIGKSVWGFTVKGGREIWLHYKLTPVEAEHTAIHEAVHHLKTLTDEDAVHLRTARLHRLFGAYGDCWMCAQTVSK